MSLPMMDGKGPAYVAGILRSRATMLREQAADLDGIAAHLDEPFTKKVKP